MNEKSFVRERNRARLLMKNNFCIVDKFSFRNGNDWNFDTIAGPTSQFNQYK